MSIRLASSAVLALSLVSVAAAGIDIVTQTNNPARKKLQAAVSETSEVVIDQRVFTKATPTATTWTVDVVETTKTAAALEEEAPRKAELEIWSAITADCNGNGAADTVDIANGAIDADNDLVPDSCEYKAGDLNLNGLIDQQDLSILMGWWGIANPLFGDLNGDNVVNGADMGILLGRYGAVVF